MSEFLQYSIIGLGKGAIYASLAIALVVVYRATGMVNFAQGEMATFSTFLTVALSDAGVSLPLAVLGSMALSFVGAAAIERVLVRPAASKGNPLSAVVVTIGLYIGIGGATLLLWPEGAGRISLFGAGGVSMGAVPITYNDLGALGLLGVECLLLWLIWNKTKIGLGLRGVASNPTSAALVGVPVGRLLMFAWGLAAALGGLAGLLAAHNQGASAALMQPTLVFALAAATLGGFDSPIGAVIGGLAVGLASELTGQYVDALGPGLKLLPAFVLILIVLLVRPQGLFGRISIRRV